ncbi:uncharacterized protein MELLADRAFT_108383 [Melampsora larici-populina 98AG31]|uniref:Uncharacterized protein n=1 Tax=Melampsora larici-populina (strain 98AG31 / pathotype 3-4-7) TaxID=747676 RepID=F4RSX6_MELLP|nr:uncharacterized protein MELLADRAFT_108383 [Melampsora larici-populina 98AG31]EGG04406.1 hypothetical protein MELLADRAFT_108383 [Melampsora larici-populina 98AG31]
MIAGNSLMRLPQEPLAVNNPLMGFTTFSAKFFEVRTWLGVTTEPVRLSTSMDSSLDSSTMLRFNKREDEPAERPTTDQQKPEKQKKKLKTKVEKKMESQSRPRRNATIPDHPHDKSLHGPKRTKEDSMAFDGSRHKNRTSAEATHMIHAPNQADHTHSISTHDSQSKLNLGNLTRLDLKKTKDGRRKKPFGYDLTNSKNRNQTMNGSTHKSSRPTSQPKHMIQASSEDEKANRTTSSHKPAPQNSELKPKKKKNGQGVMKNQSKNQNSTSFDPEIHSSRKSKHTAETSNKGASSRNMTTNRTGKDKGSKKKMTMKKGKAHNLTSPSNSSSRIVPGPSAPVRNETQVPTPVSQAPIETPSPSPTTSEATTEATPTATPTATPESASRAAPDGAAPGITPGATPEATPDQSPQDGPARNDGMPTSSKNDTMDQDTQAEKPKTSQASPDPMTSWIITFKMNATEGAIIKYNYSPVLKGLAASVPDRSFTALSKDPNIDSFDPDTVMSAQPNLDGGAVMGDSDVVSEDG